MPTKTKPRPETEEDLIARDRVATQRDVREMTHRIAARIDAAFGKSESRIPSKFDRLEAKLDRLTWIIVGGFSAIAALLVAIALRMSSASG